MAEKKKMTVQKKSKICWGISIVGLIMLPLGMIPWKIEWLRYLFWVGVGVVVLGFVLQYLLVRCPHCKASLTSYRPFPSVCPKCGEKIDE